MTTVDRIPALSISRPWATAIMAGVKPTENRTWHTNYRGLVLVHAALSWDEDAADYAALRGYTIAPDPDQHPTGVLGLVTLTGICEQAVGGRFNGHCTCPWGACDQRHWQLADPRPFPAAIPARGRLGLWWPTGELRTAITEAVAALPLIPSTQTSQDGTE